MDRFKWGGRTLNRSSRPAPAPIRCGCTSVPLGLCISRGSQELAVPRTFVGRTLMASLVIYGFVVLLDFTALALRQHSPMVAFVGWIGLIPVALGGVVLGYAGFLTLRRGSPSYLQQLEREEDEPGDAP